MVNTIGASNQIWSAAYDGQDNLIQLTDARSLVTTRVVDGFSEVIQEVSPDRGTLSYWYDADGNLTKRIDGDSVETDYAYDNANRRTAMTFPSDTAENTTFTYDQTTGGNQGVGRLTNVAEASGSTGFTYDAQGRKTVAAKVISGGGYVTPLTVQYGYDANGKVTSITYPSGDAVTYTRATDGQLTAVSFTPHGGTAQSIAAGVTYEPYGPLTGLTYGNGLILTRAYDQDYRLTALTVALSTGAAVINLGFGWQADGRLASVNDIVGNRTPAANTTTLTKVSLSTTANQALSATTLSGGAQRTLTYKTGGDLQQDVRAGGATYGYVYNAAKRLTNVTQNAASVGVYAYDFAGNRVYRQVLGASPSQTAYIYDEDGHLLAEHNAVTGAVNREYVWIDDMPVALTDISGSTYTWGYIHTGQIDEPLAVTNAAQTLAWNGYVDATGNGSTFTTPTTKLDMRLPGQSFQLEPGSLSQNRYRDYDPSLGRYIEADPLGIDAGQNVYSYAAGNPLNLRDPRGLWQGTAQVGDGEGVRVTIGHNNGQWSFGVYYGLGFGASISIDPSSDDCRPPEFNYGAETGFDLGAQSNLSAEAHAGGPSPWWSLNANIPNTPFGFSKSSDSAAPHPTVGWGGSGFVGIGATGYF